MESANGTARNVRNSCSDLEFEAIPSASERREHDTGIVHQNMNHWVDSEISVAAARTLTSEVRSRCTVEVLAPGTSARIHRAVSVRVSLLRAANSLCAAAGQRPC